MNNRLSFEESCRFLQSLGFLREGPFPVILDRAPRYDDDILGFDFFRWGIRDSELERLTLPRSYFGRSSFERCSFAFCDLSESTINWNDFEDVSFKQADLTKSDLRACIFRRVSFQGSNLLNADLRCCSYENCDFQGAILTGAKMTIATGATLNLLAEQRQVIEWHDEDGTEPDGG